jgi:hypothetical protein
MTEKVGLIKNPLTIIAIFAGIAEVSGTIVLPFVSPTNQQLFIWFLISFPSLLVITFFATLNFNNKVLYAPSDYKDEANYLTSNKYNAATQTNDLVKEPVADVIKSISLTVEHVANRVSFLENAATVSNQPIDVEYVSIEKENYTYQIASDMSDKRNFIKRMRSLGYDIQVYTDKYSEPTEPSTGNQGIWIGTSIPFEIVKEVLIEARKFYPFLKYIDLNSPDDSPFESLNDIFIGGSTSAAKGHLRLKPLSDRDFEQINKMQTAGEFHEFAVRFKY